MEPRGWLNDGGGLPGSGRVIADGGGSPRCCVDIFTSDVALTRSEFTGVSTFGFGDSRDVASGIRGEKSWVGLPPNSVLVGCERVSNMDIE